MVFDKTNNVISYIIFDDLHWEVSLTQFATILIDDIDDSLFLVLNFGYFRSKPFLETFNMDEFNRASTITS